MSDQTCEEIDEFFKKSNAVWINPDWPESENKEKGWFTVQWPKDRKCRGRPKHTESKKYYARLYRKQDRIMSQYGQDLRMGRKPKVHPEYNFTWLQRI